MFIDLRRCWLALALAFALSAHADPLYVQRVQASAPSAEALAKALEQVRKHKDIQIRDDLKVPPFHKRVDQPVAKGEAFCQGCHLPVPHSEKLRTRAFLNMHSRFIACETCHFQPKGTGLDYRWLDYGTGQPAPPRNRFRIGFKVDNGQVLDGAVKIAPFFAGEPAIASAGSAFAKRIAAEWNESDEAGRAGLKARLHAPLEKEGPACPRCHTEQNPLLDLALLGAPPEQAQAIRRHVIPQFFARYKEDDERLKIIDLLH